MEPSIALALRQLCGIRGIYQKIATNLHHGSKIGTIGFSRRCQSGTAAVGAQNPGEVEIEKPLSENDHVNELFENRNPRNLEKMTLGRKPKGWSLDYPSRSYWHKIFLDMTTRHTTARIEHFTGKTVVTASTQELAIRKHLYSTDDVSAVENIGRVIAQRCLESGILWVHVHFTKEERQTEKVVTFLKALEEGGLRLKEPFRLFPFRPWH